MQLKLRHALICLLLSVPMSSFSQKVKVGYDKGTDFLKFKSYTWAEPSMPPQRPLLYASIVASIDSQLRAKGLERMEINGDLTLIPAGGMDFGFNVAAGTPIMPTLSGPPPAIDATMWTGATGSSGHPNLMAPYVTEGTLIIGFVDRGTNKLIWSGTVREKLDIERKDKSLQLIAKSIAKLLKQFPPTTK